MPELPEVETMVRGLRPALAGTDAAPARGPRPVLAAGLFGGRPGAARPWGDGQSRWRGGASGSSWTLAGHRGIIVIQPRMTGGFWLREPDRPDHIRLVFHVEKPRAMVWYCDTRRLGKIGWYPGCAEAAAVAFARSHGPGCPGDRPRRAGGTARADGPRDQADA